MLQCGLKHRMEAYETIGGMFKNVKQNFIEYKLNERIMAVINEILNVLELIIGNIDFNEVIEKLMANSEILGFLNKTSEQENFSKLAA